MAAESMALELLTRTACGLDVRGKRILLKPNLVEYSPDTEINTNVAVIAAALEVFQKRGAAFVQDYKNLLASTGEASAADLAARFGIVYAGEFKFLEGVVQQCSTMHQLQVESSSHSLSAQEFERSCEHGIPGGLGRQSHIQSTLPETPL